MKREDLRSGAQQLVARYDLTCRLLITLIDWHQGPDHGDFHDDNSLTSDAYAIAGVLLARSIGEFLASSGTRDDDWQATDFLRSPPPFDLGPFNGWVNKTIAHATRTNTGFLPSYVGLVQALVSGMSRFVAALEKSDAEIAVLFRDVQARLQEDPIMKRAPLRSRHETVRGVRNLPPDFAWRPQNRSDGSF